jgi:hypothetical protein
VLQTRTGLVGRGYADPARAKSGAIEYGKWICDKLAAGIDRNVFISRGVAPGSYTHAEFVVEVDTATDFLCPDHGKVG